MCGVLCGQVAGLGSIQFRNWNRLVSHMRAPLAACREPAGKLCNCARCYMPFEHKRQYILIHVPFTRIVVF